jgi:methylated-DNA-[protein]-cysteine S-methyltransferase
MIIDHPSPLGPLRVRVENAHVIEILIPPMTDDAGDDAAHDLADRRVMDAARRQLDAYFARGRLAFDLPLMPRGTPFQQTVWRALRRIPAGETRSYGELAREIGRPTGSRAVGAANGRNRIAIVIPCHRVIGSSGALTGYAAGLERKAWLLSHEAEPTRGPSARATAALMR